MDWTKKQEPTTQPCYEEKQQKLKYDFDTIISSLPKADKLPQVGQYSQSFYRATCRNSAGEYILKHGYKAFRILKSQQDLAMFCLSLLQFQAQFPLKFIMIDVQQQKGDVQSENIIQKDVWLETQFLFTSDTNSQIQSNKQKVFERRVMKFFNDNLLPKLKEFQREKMCWHYMTTEQYTDEKVIQQFNEKIIKKINTEFKKFIKQI